MNWRSFVREQLAGLDAPPERQLEIVDEVANQLESIYARARAEGDSEDAAIARAKAEVPDWSTFVSTVSVIEHRPAPSPPPGVSVSGLVDGLRQDLGHAARSLRRAPGFAAAAIATLTLGIAATTSVGSAAVGVLWRPLPFDRPDQLVLVYGNAVQGFDHTPLSVADAQDLIKDSGVFASMGAWASQAGMRAVIDGDRPEDVQFAIATAGLFPTLGIEPAVGRWFQPKENELGTAPVAVISHALWQRRFGALMPGTSLAGRTLSLDGQSHDIVGVLPPGFRFATVPRNIDVWLPLGRDPNPGRRFSRGTRFLGGIARLRSDVSLARASDGVGAVATRLAKEFPEQYRTRHFDVLRLTEETTRDLRAPLALLLAAAFMMLLIACVNVANLIVVRATSHAREYAVRVSLGASRARLAGQLFAETALIATIAAAAGLALAWIGTGTVAKLLERTPNPFMPYTFDAVALSVDPRVAAIAAGLSILFSLLFAQASVWRTSVLNPAAALRSTGVSPGLSSRRWRQTLVTAEIALSVMLLTGAALLARSLDRLDRVDPGFNPDHVLTAELNLRAGAYQSPVAITGFYDRVLSTIAAEPGVTAASVIDNTPLSGQDQTTGIFIDGRPAGEPATRPRVHNRVAGGGYFTTLGIPIKQGRELAGTDTAGALRVAVINETMAKQLWPGENPIGKRFALDFEAMRYFRDRPPVFDLEQGWRVVVGVVGDVRHTGLTQDPVAEAYMPLGQSPGRAATLVIRGVVDAGVLEKAVRRIVTTVDPQQPLGRIRPLPALIAESTARPRSSTEMLVTLSALALLLAAIGIYGVVAYSMTLRIPEIGMRMALGADRWDVASLVAAEGAIPCLAGVISGAAGGAALSRVMASLLFGVSPLDPLAFGAGAITMLATTAVACAMPVRRAVRLDPASALRSN